MSHKTGRCLLGTRIGLLAYMSPFAPFCNSGISVTLNNNSNYSLCLDSSLPPLCDDSCESLLTHMLTIPLEIRGNIGCHAEGIVSLGGRVTVHVPDPQLRWGPDAPYQQYGVLPLCLGTALHLQICRI